MVNAIVVLRVWLALWFEAVLVWTVELHGWLRLHLLVTEAFVELQFFLCVSNSNQTFMFIYNNFFLYNSGEFLQILSTSGFPFMFV